MLPVSTLDRDIAENRCDRVVIVFSDIEMGPGGPVDDFPHPEFLAGLIDAYDHGLSKGLLVDLVFNGDTFDFLKTSVGGAWPHHITAEVALAKLERIIQAHAPFFDAVRRFLDGSMGNRRVHFVAGNHDAELLFEEVQLAVRRRIGAQGICFPGFALDIGDVHIEHGQQRDPMFRMDPNRLFIEHSGKRILNLSWGAVALLEVAMPLQPHLHQLDRIKPRKALFDLIPEVREFLVGAYWQYWTRDYWQGFFRNQDPIKRVSWSMFREVVYRFGTNDPELREDDPLDELLLEGPYSVLLAGHTHRPSLISWGTRRLLRTGCLRNEFMLGDAGRSLQPIPKVFAEVTMRGDHALHSRLVEIDGPRAPSEQLPDSLFDVLPIVQRLLGPQEERDQTHADQEAQHRREAEE